MNEPFENDAQMNAAIERSSVVGKCRDCGGKVTELEIELGFASSDECTECVRGNADDNDDL